jgi:hypothetical protein
MSKIVKLGIGLGSIALGVASQCVAASAAGAPAAISYHGTWYEATAPDCTQVPVSGRWSVTLKQDGTASVSVAIFMSGELHAAWGGNALGAKFAWTQSAGGHDLTLGPVAFTIDGDQVRFDIPNRYPACDAHVLGTVA